MDPKYDNTGKQYFDVGNIRITCLKKVSWKNENIPGLRIQAYKDENRATDGLFPGPEIPIKDKRAAVDLIKGICDGIGGIDFDQREDTEEKNLTAD